MLPIESRDGRNRATAEATEAGIRVRRLRHGGGMDLGDAQGMTGFWRVLETFTVADEPMHVVLDHLHRLGRPVGDDRPIPWPGSRRWTRPVLPDPRSGVRGARPPA